MEVIAGADKLKSLSDQQKPTVAIITNLLCEKLAVDALIERKTTYIRYKTEGEPNYRTIERLILSLGDSNVYTIGYIGSVKVISVKLPMVGWELQAKISSGSITTRLLGASYLPSLFIFILFFALCGILTGLGIFRSALTFAVCLPSLFMLFDILEMVGYANVPN